MVHARKQEKEKVLGMDHEDLFGGHWKCDDVADLFKWR